jgi:hypothetical protein
VETQGRVIAGYMNNGMVSSANSGLIIQFTLKRQRINAETVSGWEEIGIEIPKPGVAGRVAHAASRAALPGILGKAVGAGVGAAIHTEEVKHTVRIDWADGKQSVIELPAQQFLVLGNLLKARQIGSNLPIPEPQPMADSSQPSVASQVVGLASSLLHRDKAEPDVQSAASGPEANDDIPAQITKLAKLRDQGILTEEEFAAKKADLLNRL